MSKRGDKLIYCKSFRDHIYEKYCDADGILHCVCCGKNLSYGEMKIHHILPFQQGGADIESNCVPVCSECHYKLHHLKTTDELLEESVKERRKMNSFSGGRPKKAVRSPETDKIFMDYRNGYLSRKDACKMLGYAPSTKITDLTTYKDFCRENNLPRVICGQSGRFMRDDTEIKEFEKRKRKEEAETIRSRIKSDSQRLAEIS